MLRLKNLDQLRDTIRSSARFEDVVRTMYGIQLTQVNDDDLKGCCPFHEEKTPSFGIRKSKGMYHCFGCKAGGDLFKFVQQMDNCDHIEAIKKLAEFGGIDLRQFQVPTSAEEQATDALYELNRQTAVALETDTPEFNEWVSKRRFDRGVLKEFGLGYAANPPGLTTIPEHVSLELTTPALWENVIVVPVRDHYGRIVSFMNRRLDPNAKPKVIGTSSKHPFPRVPIYGLYEARKFVRQTGYLILVEGEPDVWQMAAHGYRNVASMRGTQLTDDAIALLESLAINRVIVMADNDEAGRRFAATLAQQRLGCKVSIKIATLHGNGKDPDEILLADGEGPIDHAIASATYAFEHVIRAETDKYDLTRATDRLDFLNDLKPKLIKAPPLEQALAAKMIGPLIGGMDPDTISDFFKETTDTQNVQLHNIHGERVVLKRMLEDESFIGDALTALKSTDFYLTKHKIVFEAISKLFRSQKPINREIVETTLENQQGQTFGVRAILASILETSGNPDSARWFLDELRDRAIRREVQAQANEAIRRLSDTKIDAKEVITNLGVKISNAVVAEGGGIHHSGDVVQDRMNLLNERMASPNAIVGFDLGAEWWTINHTIHGLQTKRYCVLSAPTGTGKTALACNLTKILAVDQRIPSLFFTFETGIETLTDRLIANCSGVPSDKVVTGYISAEEVETVQDAALRVAQAPLIMTERGISMEECLSIIRSDVLRRGTKFVVVDYIQLMHSTDRAIASLRRDQELGHISRAFLNIAKELDIVLVALSQHNRESAKNASTSKESIGESYKIIQDADIGLFFREKSKEEKEADGPDKGSLVMQLAKHRHGKGGVMVKVIYDADVCRMREYRPPAKVDVSGRA